MCWGPIRMASRPLVIMPVKSFDLAKGRLASALSVDERRALGSALAARTAWTARDAGADVVVIAGAEEVRHWAQRIGFAAVAQPADQPGLNGAVAFGTAMATDPERHVYVLHADLPLINAPVLRRAFAIAGPVIAPSRDGGTTLLGGIPNSFRFSYGVGSYTQHLSLLPTATPLISPELALDIDTVSDLERALATRRGHWLRSVVGTGNTE